MTAVRSVAAAAAELGNTFSGQLLEPGNAGYEEARKVHNGLVDKRPALIAQCADATDVADAIRLTRRLGLEVAVRGGGHNVAGRATIDGGVMIDLAPMKEIRVEPENRRVRAQCGVTWGELNRETQRHGLAVTGGVVSSTGIAGLTLGGGLGWLMGKHGLALDNLVSVELITAECDAIRTSKDEKPDLFWAVRGGGGNFGVATGFEYQLHPVGPEVTSGLIAHPFERARDVLRFYRNDTSPSLPASRPSRREHEPAFRRAHARRAAMQCMSLKVTLNVTCRAAAIPPLLRTSGHCPDIAIRSFVTQSGPRCGCQLAARQTARRYSIISSARLLSAES